MCWLGACQQHVLDAVGWKSCRRLHHWQCRKFCCCAHCSLINVNGRRRCFCVVMWEGCIQISLLGGIFWRRDLCSAVPTARDDRPCIVGRFPFNCTRRQGNQGRQAHAETTQQDKPKCCVLVDGNKSRQHLCGPRPFCLADSSRVCDAFAMARNGRPVLKKFGGLVEGQLESGVQQCTTICHHWLVGVAQGRLYGCARLGLQWGKEQQRSTARKRRLITCCSAQIERVKKGIE